MKVVEGRFLSSVHCVAPRSVPRARLAWLAGCVSALMTVAALGADVAPKVSIVAPASPFATNQRYVDVTVHFDAAQGNCKYIDLLLNDQLVARYENPANVKDGDHTFVGIDLSTALNREVRLAAIGYQGSPNSPNGASDPNAPGASITIRYDTAPPTVSNLVPAPDALLASARPTVSAEYADALSGILLSAVLPT